MTGGILTTETVDGLREGILSSDPSVRDEALKEILKLATNPARCIAIGSNIDLLYALRDHLQTVGETIALSIISYLCLSKENRVLMVSSGIVTSLIKVLRDNLDPNIAEQHVDSGEKRGIVLAALWSVSDTKQNKITMIDPELHLVEVMIIMLNKADEHERTSTLGIIWNLSEPPENRSFLLEPSLKLLSTLRTVIESTNDRARIMALSIVSNIVEVNDNSAIISSGVVEAMQTVITTDTSEARTACLAILCKLTRDSILASQISSLSLVSIVKNIITEDTTFARINALQLLLNICKSTNDATSLLDTFPELMDLTLNIIKNDKSEARILALSLICIFVESNDIKNTFLSIYPEILTQLFTIIENDKHDARVKALSIVWCLSEIPENTKLLLNPELKFVTILQDIASTDKKGARLKALGLMYNLTNTEADLLQLKASSIGLAKVLRDTIVSDSGEARIIALEALRHMAETEDMRFYLTSSPLGLLRILKDLVAGTDEDAKMKAFELLSSVSKCTQSKQSIAAPSLGLLPYLKDAINSHTKNRLYSLMILSDLSENVLLRVPLLSPSLGLVEQLMNVIHDSVEMHSSLALYIIANCATAIENKTILMNDNLHLIIILYDVLLRFSLEARLHALTIINCLVDEVKLFTQISDPSLEILTMLGKIAIESRGQIRQKTLTLLANLVKNPANIPVLVDISHSLVRCLTVVAISDSEKDKLTALTILQQFVKFPLTIPAFIGTNSLVSDSLCDLVLSDDEAIAKICVDILLNISIVTENKLPMVESSSFFIETIEYLLLRSSAHRIGLLDIVNHLCDGDAIVCGKILMASPTFISTLREISASEKHPCSTAALKIVHRLVDSVGKHIEAWEILHTAANIATPEKLTTLLNTLGLSCSEHLSICSESQLKQISALLKAKSQKTFIDLVKGETHPTTTSAIQVPSKRSSIPPRVVTTTPLKRVFGTKTESSLSQAFPIRRMSAPSAPSETGTPQRRGRCDSMLRMKPDNQTSTTNAFDTTLKRSSSVCLNNLPSRKVVSVGKLSDYIHAKPADRARSAPRPKLPLTPRGSVKN